MFARFYSMPVLLLVFGTAFWGGNAVVGRASIHDISPIAISFCKSTAIHFTNMRAHGLQQCI